MTATLPAPSAMERLPSGLRRAVDSPWAPAAVSAVAALLVVFAVLLNGVPTDLPVYRRAASTLLGGTDTLYRTVPGDLPFTYPPFAALLFTPLTVVPVPTAMVALALASVAALARLLTLCLARVGAPGPGRRLALLALPVCLLAEPVWETLRLGQVNLLLAWLVVEDLLGPDRGPSQRSGGSPWRGALVGVAAGIKLVPGIFGLIPLLRRDWATCLRMTGAGVGTIALGYLVAPQSSSAYWTSILFDANRVGGVAYVGNQSVDAALWRAAGPGGVPLFWATGSAVILLLVAYLVWRSERGSPAGSPAQLEGLVLVGLAGVLVSPISWSHHWIWVCAVFVALAAEGRRADGRPHPGSTALLAGWLVVTLTHLLWWFPNTADVEFAANPLVKLFQDAYLLLALATLIWFAMRGRAARRGRTAETGSRRAP